MRRTGGFTLLEVLVALAVLSTALVMAYRVMSESLAAEERSERWTEGALFAEGLMRDALASFPETGETDGRFPPPNEAYTWRRTILEAPHTDAREVRISVAWESGGRRETVFLAGVAVR